MTTAIRPALKSDCAAILEFVRELAIYEKLEHEVIADVPTLENTLFGGKPVAEVIFLEENEIKVGMALFFYNFSTFLGRPGIYLEDLFVKPSHRGKGYGKRLLAYLAKLAVERNCGRLEWSVLDWNKPALDFYRSLNAEPMSEWTVQRLTGPALKSLASQSREEEALP
jgi:GNAT superfamily N-acetyltransferase